MVEMIIDDLKKDWYMYLIEMFIFIRKKGVDNLYNMTLLMA